MALITLYIIIYVGVAVVIYYGFQEELGDNKIIQFILVVFWPGTMPICLLASVVYAIIKLFKK